MSDSNEGQSANPVSSLTLLLMVTEPFAKAYEQQAPRGEDDEDQPQVVWVTLGEWRRLWASYTTIMGRSKPTAEGSGMTRVPAPSEVAAAMSPKGGWTREQLAEWGIPWPPARGWRVLLERLHEAETELFDAREREARYVRVIEDMKKQVREPSP